MIASIVDGGNTAGLMMYLVGPGRANEHTAPHVVGGDGFFTRRWGDWPELSSAQGYEIARRLDQYMDEYQKRPMGNVREYDPELDKVVVVGRGRNHVWHCSLSLRPDEPALSDEAWGRITQEFMDSLGLTGADGKAPCRWVAVRHGLSKGGGDHVHIVANIVRADGTLWSRWQDETKSSKAVNRIERAHGLHVIEAREHARGARADSAADLRASAARGQDETDRRKLERRARAAALGARDECDFVWRARSMGIRLRPRYAPGSSDVVVGYSMALHVPDGQETRWYGGGRVARDLALPRLRARWGDTPQSAQRAVDAWRGAWWSERPATAGRYDPMAGVAQRARGLEVLVDGIRGIDPRDPVAMADASRDVSGALGALALACEDRGARLALERAAIVVGRQGQTHRRDAPARPAPDALMDIARLATAAAADARVAALMLVIEVLRLAEALSDLHAAADQARTARDMLDSTAAALEALDARALPQAPASVTGALEASRSASQQRAAGAGRPGGDGPRKAAPSPAPEPSRVVGAQPRAEGVSVVADAPVEDAESIRAGGEQAVASVITTALDRHPDAASVVATRGADGALELDVRDTAGAPMPAASAELTDLAGRALSPDLLADHLAGRTWDLDELHDKLNTPLLRAAATQPDPDQQAQDTTQEPPEAQAPAPPPSAPQAPHKPPRPPEDHQDTTVRDGAPQAPAVEDATLDSVRRIVELLGARPPAPGAGRRSLSWRRPPGGQKAPQPADRAPAEDPQDHQGALDAQDTAMSPQQADRIRAIYNLALPPAGARAPGAAPPTRPAPPAPSQGADRQRGNTL